MSLPRLAAFVVRRLAQPGRVKELLGDLEEVHRERLLRRSRAIATLLTVLEAVECAAASGLMRLGTSWAPPVSWIDFKLGARMLVKYPGLTLVGGAAMAFGIFAGAACYEGYSQVLHPRLPFDEGERVVMVDLLDDRTQARELRVLHDFAQWRTDLSTVEQLGAANSLAPYLVTDNGRGQPVRAAAMTGSAFQMTRVPPLMGRTLDAADESPAAPDVLVLGYDVWQSRFGGDLDVLGRKVVVGDTEYAIVGVMPQGFGFPAREQAWFPLRFDPSVETLQGPATLVFGRLAPGVSFDQAQAEVNRYIAQAAAERPAEYAHLHARVMPYAEAMLDIRERADRLGVMSVNVFAGLFLMLVCGNVALLMFARAAAREGELVVRNALGATRRRIVSQLFAEALVLGLVAAFVGVAAAGWGLDRFANAFQSTVPLMFWYHTSLSPRTYVYAALLTLFAAAIAGVVPGLKVTSGKVDSRLRRLTAGGGGLRFGGLWTAVIVVQIAATVTFPVVGYFVRRDAVNIESYEFGVPTEEYVSARLHLNPAMSGEIGEDADTLPFTTRFGSAARGLMQRLEAEPEVAGVTMSRTEPGTYHAWRRIEMDAGYQTPRTELDEKGPGRWVAGGVVAPNFFDVMGTEPLQGRTFHADDADPEARTVIVNQPFVDVVLGGRNPIGRRLRYVASPDGWDGVERAGSEPGPWYRIVGVVPELGMRNGANVGIYHAREPESLWTPTLLVHVNGDARAFTGRLIAIAGEVEPDLALLAPRTLDMVKENDLRLYSYWLWLIAGVSGLAVLLSLAGIYSVMAFTVARRTREIGVRVALGGRSARIAGAIFRKPLLQVAWGILLGLLISTYLGWGIDAEGLWGKPLLVLLGYGTVMTGVCLLACLLPLRRALSVEPSQALAADG